jgi:hypothetical protein
MIKEIKYIKYVILKFILTLGGVRSLFGTRLPSAISR